MCEEAELAEHWVTVPHELLPKPRSVHCEFFTRFARIQPAVRRDDFLEVVVKALAGHEIVQHRGDCFNSRGSVKERGSAHPVDRRGERFRDRFDLRRVIVVSTEEHGNDRVVETGG